MAALPKDEEKRKRIIAAAIEVFAHDGVSNGKIAKIAEKAGIGKGTIYEYFGSKEDIFAAVFADFFEKMMAGYAQLFTVPVDPVRKIEMMFDYTYDLLDQQLDQQQNSEWLILLEIFMQGFRDEFRGTKKLSFGKILRDLYAAFKPFVEEGVRAGVFRSLDPEHVTFILFGALDGISLHYFINRMHYDKKKLQELTREIFLRGILKPVPTEGE